MKQYRILTAACLAAVLAASAFAPAGKGSLIEWGLTPLTAEAAESKAAAGKEADTPFHITGKVKSAAMQKDGAKFSITDEKDLNAIAGELNALAAVKVDYQKNPDTSDNVWRGTLTLVLEGKEFTYYLEDQKGSNSGTMISVDSSAEPGIDTYQSSRTSSVLRGILDGICEKDGRFPYLLPNADAIFDMVLINNEKRTSIDVRNFNDNSGETDQVADALSKISVIQREKGTANIGDPVYGVDEMRINVFEGRIAYRFYENGIAVTPMYGPDKGQTIFYSCQPKSLKEFYQLNAKLFAYRIDKINASWLGLMSPQYYKSAKISIPTVKNAKTLNDSQMFTALKGLHVFSNSKTEVSSLPKKWDYSYELSFTTGVTYSIRIAGNYLYIKASDIDGEILRYTLIEDETLEGVKAFTENKLIVKK